MFFKAYPRVWVDLTVSEAFSVLLQLLNPVRARSQKKVPEFEKAFADFMGKKHAVSFTNCRSSLLFSLMALNLEEGDEVIMPAFTFWVDVAMVILAGLKPVFVDVQFETLNIDASKIEAAITSQTRVILPAHLNGLMCDMDELTAVARKHKLRIIEDTARTCAGYYKGKRAGTYDIGAFSFGYGKSFYGFGGGMVVSDDDDFIARLREIKKDFHPIAIPDLFKSAIKGFLLKFLNTPSIHGITLFPMAKKFQLTGEKYKSWFKIIKPAYDEIPELFRNNMYNIQAKLGFRQIKTIDESNKKRHANLELYNRELAGIDNLKIPPNPDDRMHVCVHYAVWTESKKELQQFLLNHNIDAQDESAEDVTQMERFKPYVKGAFPNAEKLHEKIIYIPAHPCLKEKDLLYISDKINEFYKTN